ncbi:MAG: hypothetical protein ACO3B0_07070 [Chitinophagaceae bacterium]
MQTYTSRELFDWLLGKARSAASIRRNLINATQQQSGTTIIGKMYFFSYDAKTKDTLPRWDRYPLVFPIERYNDGFLGLNVHYLSPAERQALLNRLTSYATAKNLTEKSRLRLTYDLIASTKKLNSLARPCIKRYLYSHVRSKFVEIPATEWDRVIQLPLEVFVTKG